MVNQRFSSPKWFTVRGLVVSLISTYLGSTGVESTGPDPGIEPAYERYKPSAQPDVSQGEGSALRGERPLRRFFPLPETVRSPRRRANRGLSSDRDGATTPEQVHLALADATPRETYAMSVSWLTRADAASHVFWGLSEGDLSEVATGDTTSYTAHHVNINAPPYTSGVLHSATIADLEPSTTYFYVCGDESLGLSTVRSFRTPGMVGFDQAVTIGILGDLGQTSDSVQTMDSVLTHEPPIEVVLHAGDVSYANCVQTMWDTFMRLLDPAASRVPWMVAAGNHEIEDGSTEGEPFAAYEHRFSMPSIAPAIQNRNCSAAGGGLDGNQTACGAGLGEGLAPVVALKAASDDLPVNAIAEAARRAREAQDPLAQPVITGWSTSDAADEEPTVPETEMLNCCPSEWSGTYDYGNSFYSFDVASVHVVVLNPYTATGSGSIQHEWLIQDLANVDRTLTPWIVAMFHCPWYNSNLEHQGERQAATAMKVMEPLLFQYRTALIASGHVHAYERSVPVVSGKPAAGAPIHVVVGGAGNRERHDPDYYLPPEWSAFRNGSTFGLGTLSIMNSTTALWEWKSNAPEPVVQDSTWIINPYLLE